MLDYPTRAEREAQYSPSSVVGDIGPLLDRYASESAKFGRSCRLRPSSTDRIPPRQWTSSGPRSRGRPCLIHGGYWQELSKDDASCLGSGIRRTRVTYVALGYPLAPGASVDEIVESCVKAVTWLLEQGMKVIVSGSSAGAHLAAMVATRCPVAGVVLLSGVFDLRPLVDTYINLPLSLDAESAAALSPLLMDPVRIPTLIAFGEMETAAFKAQSRAMAEHWGVLAAEIANRNHFDLIFDIADPSTMLGAAARELEGA